MNLLSTKQVTDSDRLLSFFKETDLIRESVGSDVARGKVLGIVKDEGSTRTRVSFEVAMKRLGGEVVLLELDNNSSAAKGESVEDSVHTISQYVDVVVMRHSQRGMVQKCASKVSIPFINAGDGDGEHPTQALLDTYTIYKEHGRLNNIGVMLVGDLKCSRTVHSLIYLLDLFQNVTLYLCSPSELELSPEYKSSLSNVRIVEGNNFYDMLSLYDVDVLYMTRLQKERYKDLSLDDYYVLGDKEVACLSDSCRVLHPLPRNGEIPCSFDSDPRATYYHSQMENGMYVRMALLKCIFDNNNIFE